MANDSLMKVESNAEKGEHSAILLACIKLVLVLKTLFSGLL